MVSQLTATVYQYGRLVKFSHSLFALPFALSMVVLVSKSYQVTTSQIVLIFLCCVTARTAAMGWNRYVDRDIDKENPRTAERELVTGVIGSSAVRVFITISGGLFLLFSLLLGRHCFMLAPLVLFLLFFYSSTKRFTSLAHVFLGLALALAPGGVWYALTATVSFEPFPLMFAVLFWVAGFDILYSAQDKEFDSRAGLYSVPVAFGLKRAFMIAKLFHALTTCLLIVNGFIFELSLLYYGGVLLFGLFLFSQYLLISPSSLEQIDTAFFNRNALASVFFFLTICLDVALTNGFSS